MIKGICKIIQDSKGNDYLAIDIEKEYSSAYEAFMLSQGFIQEVDAKLNRDNGNYHITIINTMQWGSLRKKDLIKPILDIVNNKEFTFESFGIGSANKDENKTFFIILENKELLKLRNIYSLGEHDFHLTLGFNKKDVFGIPKNKSTLIFSNDLIFKTRNKFKP